MLSPLNWGLGHVSRTVPIIQLFLENKNEIIICCNEDQERFYRKYFPSLWYIPHEGYPFRFKGNGKWTLDILSNFSSLHLFLKDEKRKVADLVEKFNPDLIVSDQRFGFISKSVKSIIISHQLNLPVSNWNVIVKLWNKKLLAAFDEIWIPDTKQQSYSGSLSNGREKVKHFIGICSRFKNTPIEGSKSENETYKYLGIVSGPAPYHQQLLHILTKKMKQSAQKCVLIVPEKLYDESLNSKQITIISSPGHDEFMNLLQNSKIIISRSGYSTLMDLAETKKEAILIPTPGQSEQLYLSKLHKDHKTWRFKTEDEFLEMQL